MYQFLLILPILFPILSGLILLFLPGFTNYKKINWYVGVSLVLTAVFVIFALIGGGEQVVVFSLNEYLPLMLKLDSLGKFFVSIVTIIWLCCGFFAFSYMEHENHPRRFFAFYLMTYGVLVGLDFAGNLITMYMFYEFMTLVSFSLVVHNQSREAIMSGLKYLLYSFFGAYMSLFGIYFVIKYAETLTFTPGGVFSQEVLVSHGQLFLIVIMLMIIGFGVKAGMFPFHAWLTAAHPVAPAPASAALSSVIVKSGVLALIRVVYYIFGGDFIKGTWVQTVWICLTLATVFMGSMLAYREKVLKKRLAYSTVSQISYILFGLAMVNSTSFTGSLLHVAAHACIKCTLFLCAGAIIYKTGCTNVYELKGIGKRMPVTMWCYTFASLALIGIPPTGGFISKWYLAVGSLGTGMKVFAVLGPVVLLISALLTAGYLLPITIDGFLPGEEYEEKERCEAPGGMVIPIVVLTILGVGIGVFAEPLVDFSKEMAYVVEVVAR